MAYVQGTATNFLDFYNKLRNFLISNPTLIAEGEAWTQLSGNTGALGLTDGIVLVGPGLTGTDQVRVRLIPSVDISSGRYNLILSGLPNWNPGLAQDAQFNPSPGKIIHLWNNSMDYTFVANGRRFVAIAQVTSVVQACYAGFGLPYGLPSEYPYPMVIGGSSDIDGWTYSVVTPRHCHFVCPNRSMVVYTPGNVWVDVINFEDSSSQYSWRHDQAHTAPYTAVSIDNNGTSYNARESLGRVKKCFGGDYPMIQVSVLSPIPTMARLLDLEGCSWVPGVENSHGSIINDGGDLYMVVQNVFRTDNLLGYWAMRLN